MKRSWKLVPFAALAALGVLALLSSGNTGTANASPTLVTVSSTTVSSGGSINATVVFDTDEQAIDIRMSDLTGGVSGGSITLVSASLTGTGTVTGSLPATAAASASGTPEIYSVPGGTMDNLDANDTAQELTVVVSIQPSCATATGTFRIRAFQGATQQFSATVTCSPTTTTPTATGTPATATPTVTGTPGAAHTITVSAAPQSLGCQGSAFITAVVKTADGQNVPDGTQVALTTTLGSISPPSAATLGGGVLAVLTAPASQGGPATVRAQVGTVFGEAIVQITCAQATNTPVPPAATQPPTGIQPPATGDAGMARDNFRAYAGIAMLAVSVLGALAVVRKRSEA